MALIHWWPLNGDLKDYGLEPINLTVNTAPSTQYVDGKIGKCYNFNGAVWLRAPGVSCGKDVSIACWAKTTINSKMIWGMQCAASNYMNFFHYNNICLNTGDGGSNYYADGSTAAAVLLDGNWHHYVVVFNGDNKSKLYIDGVYKGTANTYKNPTMSNQIFSIGSWTYNTGTEYCWNGGINDVRFYNHSLSLNEIKEISKGLILHYDFENAPTTMTNLVKNATYGVYNNYSSSGTTGSLTKLDEKFEGCDVYRLTMTPNDSSISNFRTSLYSHGIMGFGRTFLANTKYVFWIYYRLVTHQDCRVGGTASNIGGWSEIPPKNYKNDWYVVGQYRNGTVTTDKYDSIFTSFYTPTAVSGQPISIDFVCPTLVQGITEIINTNYQNFGKNIIYDVSGYKNNGSCYGATFRTIENSAIGMSSGVFDGTANSVIACGRNAMVNDAITVSFWAYMDNWANYGRAISCTEGGGWNFEPNGSYLNWPVYLSGVGYKSCVSTKTLASLSSGWHLITGTYNGLISKIYFDGVLDNTLTCASTKTLIGYNANNGIFIGGEAAGSTTAPTSPYFNGKIADVKIYATALTDTDVYNLYTSRAEVDKKYNLSTCCFFEDDSRLNYSLLTNNSVFNTRDISETELSLSEYTRIEYLEATGTQLIDTGFSPDLNTRVEYKCKFSSSHTTNGSPMIGTRLGSGNENRFFPIAYESASGSAKTGRVTLGNSQNFFNIDLNSIYIGYMDAKNLIGKYNSTDISLINNNFSKSANNNMYIFGASGYGTEYYHAKGRIYYCRIFSGNNIVRDFIPVRRTSDNVLGLYDLVGNQFYTNAGTGTFVAGPEIEIPKSYQKLNYLGFSGAQYIQTNITTMTAPFEVEVTYNKTNTGTSDQCLFGERNFGKFTNIYNSYYESAFGNTASGTVPGNTGKHVIKMKSSSGLYEDDRLLLSGSLSSRTGTYGALIGAFTESSSFSAKWFFSGYIYDLKIIENNTTTHHFIPVKRKSDSVLGMYDLVTGNFYTNAGSGSFTAGPAVANGAFITYDDGTLIANEFIEK